MCCECVRTGAEFEKRKNMRDYFLNKGFDVVAEENYGYEIFDKDNNFYGTLLEKCEIYPYLVDHTANFETWQGITSKRNQPDAVLVRNNTFYIIEMKFQKEDSKSHSQEALLPYCDFKKKQYQKLLIGTDFKVKFCYLLSESFKKREAELKDTYQYIEDVGCQYFIDEIPIEYFN